MPQVSLPKVGRKARIARDPMTGFNVSIPQNTRVKDLIQHMNWLFDVCNFRIYLRKSDIAKLPPGLRTWLYEAED